MFSSLTARGFVITLLFLAMAFPPEVFGDGIEKRVVFPKGRTSVTYQGKLAPLYEGYDAYILRAKKGQTLSVKLTSGDPNAILAIHETKVLESPKDVIVGNGEKLREWTGKLPITSQYEVQVYVADGPTEQSPGAAYSITITLR